MSDESRPVRLQLSHATASIKFGGSAHATVLIPMPDDHAVFGLVGLLAAEGARVENPLDRAIAILLGVDENAAACVTGQMIGPNPRFAAIAQLLHQRRVTGPIKDLAGNLQGKANGPFDARNRALHDPWMVDKENPEQVFQRVTRPRNLKKFATVARSKAELEAHVEKMRQFRASVTDLYNQIWERFRR